MKSKLLTAALAGALVLLVTQATAQSGGGGGGSRPTDAEVGDAASFGRNVKWLGLATTGFVQLSSDCTPDPDSPLGPDDRCVTLNPAPATTVFDFPDLGRITIPGRSANSLLCHWATPIISYSMSNPTGVAALSRITVRGRIRVESPVLANPALINPNTGEPFGGGIDTSLPTYRDFDTMQPGEFSSQSITPTRACIAGFFTKKALVETYGLSAAQANDIFNQPLTIRVGISGNASLVDSGGINFGVRITGD